MQTLRAPDLGDIALAAAERFRAEFLPQLVAKLEAGADVAVILQHADSSHADWRRSMVRDLARAHAPVRVNFTTAGLAADETAALAYLAAASGITGQYLPLHHD